MHSCQRLTAIPLYLLFFLSSWSVIVPRLGIGSVGVGLDDALAVFVFPFLIFSLLVDPERRYVRAFWFVVFLFVFFVCLYFPMGSWVNAIRMNEARYPTELWQYAKRLTFFLVAFYFVLNVKDGERRAISIISGSLLFALLIGVVQLTGTPIGDYFAELYGRSDAMLERLVNRSFGAKRIYGVAGHPNAWGGFSVFAFAITAPFFLSSVFRGERLHVLIGLVSLFSLINVMFSGSRGAIASLMVVCSVILVWYLFTPRVPTLRKTLVTSLVSLTLAFGVYIFWGKIINLIFRFSVLVESAGGGRDQQILDGLSVIRSAREWLFGSSNAIQRLQGVSHGVEVEPVYLLINYGLLGVSMLAAILGVLLYSAYRLMVFRVELSVPLGLGMVSAVAGYMIFSIGYFFFQELVVGTTFWLFSGAFLACYQKYTVNYVRRDGCN